MASSSNPKRVKTVGHKQDKGKKKQRSFTYNFFSQLHLEHFEVVHNRRLIMERKVEEVYPEAEAFGDEIMRRKWSQILTYPASASITIVHEFYANAHRFSVDEEPFLGYVRRGKRILFDSATINSFLGIEWPEGIASCEYVVAKANNFQDIDFDDVERVLCAPGGRFQRNSRGVPLHVKRSILTPLCQYWVALLHANISPCSHVSDLVTSRAILLYYILQGRQINLGQFIAQEIFDCAQSTNPKAPLGHLSLVVHLCTLVGVFTTVDPFERPRKTINRAYFRQYCVVDEAALPIPDPHPPRPRQPRRDAQQAPPVQLDQSAPQDPFAMAEIRQMLQHLGS
ncbi:hypothetical protein V8G54_003126 [Vigna mungo]|uniref:Putative plant transposon protein domain-containing protein n=1 Tax=Vigna mungo TaxID=3915 RepID=A0AAQ3PBH5_VIGMU